MRDALESGLISAWKYFEHGWDVTGGGPSLAQMQADKESWAQDIESAVDNAIIAADSALSDLFTTPDEDRVAVFNPLAFSRTDVAEIVAPGAGPFVVTDIATGLEVPNQLFSRDSTDLFALPRELSAISRLPRLSNRGRHARGVARRGDGINRNVGVHRKQQLPGGPRITRPDQSKRQTSLRLPTCRWPAATA